MCAIFLYQQSRCSSHSGWTFFKRHSLPPRSTIAWLTSELFWVLAAKADVLIDKGREGIFSVEADGNCKGRVLKKNLKKILIVSICYFLISYDILTVSSSILCRISTISPESPLTLTFPFALTAYLSVAHTLAVLILALSAAVIAGTVIAPFCVGMVKRT